MTEPTSAIEWEKQGDVTVVQFRSNTVSEASNVSKACQEIKELAENVGGKMLFSLANVEFISSAGISALLWLNEYLRSHNGQLKICGARREVFEVFTIGRLHKILAFYDTEADAMAEFKREQLRPK